MSANHRDAKPATGANVELLGDLKKQKESIALRESALKELTEDAYKTIEQYIESSRKFEDLEYEMMELINENDHLREELDKREAENQLLTEEYKNSIGYIEELHLQLVERIEEIAHLEMEVEKFKVQLLATGTSMPPSMSATTTDRGVRPTGDDKGMAKVGSTFQRHTKAQSSIRKIHGFRERANLILNKIESDSQLPQLTTAAAEAPRGRGGRRHSPRNQQQQQQQLRNRKDSSQMGAGPSTVTAAGSDSPPFAEDRGFYIQQMNVLRKTIAEKESHITLLQSKINKFTTFEQQRKAQSKAGGAASGATLLDPDDRSRAELLHIIRRNMEEKIHWQTYAEQLLKRIISGCPSLINLSNGKSAVGNGGRGGAAGSVADADAATANVWQEYALTLIQKVITQAPTILNQTDLTMAERAINDQLQRTSVGHREPATLPGRGAGGGGGGGGGTTVNYHH